MLFAVAYFAKSMLLPLVLGVLLALTLSPLVRGASRFGIASYISAGFLIFGLLASLGVMTLLLSGTVSGWVTELPDLGNEIRDRLSSVMTSVEAVKDATKEVEELAQPTEGDVQKVSVQQPPLLSSAISNVAAFLTSLGVGMVLAFFILASGNLFYIKLVQAFPKMRDKKKALTIVYDIERRISHYLLSIASINAMLGVAITMALFVVGMPYPYLWGFLAFLLNFIPFIGAIVGVLAVAGVAIVTFDTLSYAALAPLSYLSLTTLEGHFITPVLLGKRLNLNTISVFVTVIFWAWLWGIPGALLAVPALVVLKVVADNVESLSTLSSFLSGRDEVVVKEDTPATSPAS